MGRGSNHCAGISREWLAFDRRLGGLHHRSQRTGQVQNAGADCFGGSRHPRPSLETVAGWGLYFSGPLDCFWGDRVYGFSVSAVVHRLLCRVLVEDRPESGEAPPPCLRPQSAEEARCARYLMIRPRLWLAAPTAPSRTNFLPKSALCSSS